MIVVGNIMHAILSLEEGDIGILSVSPITYTSRYLMTSIAALQPAKYSVSYNVDIFV